MDRWRSHGAAGESTVEMGPGLGPPNPPPRPESADGRQWRRTRAPPLPSPISSADLHQGAAMRGDSQPIVIYVAEGSGVRVRGAGAGRSWGGGRWIRGVTGGDNLITAFYLLSSSSSALAALARLAHVTSLW